jgi:hypothetical protein
MIVKRMAFASLLAVLIISGVSATATVANVSRVYVLDQSGTTPFNIWAGAIILGLILILLSFMHFHAGEEAIISILAWIPIGYAMVTSFAVDTVSGSAGSGIAGSGGAASFTPIEIHTIHHYDVIAVVLFIMLAFAIGNTYRIAVNQRKMQEMMNPEQSWTERNQPGRFEE